MQSQLKIVPPWKEGSAGWNPLLLQGTQKMHFAATKRKLASHFIQDTFL